MTSERVFLDADVLARPLCESDPPEIPAARADSTGRPRRPLLVWVRTGAAHVLLDGDVAFRLGAGQGAWIPADGWERRVIVTEPGTVAFPLWQLPGAGAVSQPTRLEVPLGWQDWLIQHFNLQVTPFRGGGQFRDDVADLLLRPGPRPSAAPRRGDTGPAAPLAWPELPRAAGARAVAEALLRDPGLDLTVEQWAARALSSPRTIRRGFLAGTGETFEQWRLRNRLIAAVELLAAGYDVDQVAARVGFASRNGFTRAFKRQFGPTPHDFRRRLSASGVSVGLTRRAALARQADDLARLVRGDDAAAPDLPPWARTPSHANDVHVLSWMYRGSGYLDIGASRHERPAGAATWIPAGVEHVTGLRENSISLPLGTVTASDMRLTDPLQVRFSPAWDDYLMFCSISDRSGLRPDGWDHRHILDLFAEHVARRRALSAPMPTDPRARAAAMDCLRRIGETGGPPAARLPAAVRRAFREETGMTFARWRHAARMRVARDLLAGGAKPGAVARRVGYTHLSTFSAAFTRFHGLPASDVQAREVESI
jgi:AraC-like DNA-binding protein